MLGILGCFSTVPMLQDIDSITVTVSDADRSPGIRVSYSPVHLRRNAHLTPRLLMRETFGGLARPVCGLTFLDIAGALPP